MARSELKTIVHADWDECWPRISKEGLVSEGIKVIPYLSSTGLTEKVRQVGPDMLITELALDAHSMWRAHGLECMMILARTNPDLPIMVLSSVLSASRIRIIADRGPKFACVTVKQDWPGGTRQLVGYIKSFWDASQSELKYREWLNLGFPKS